MTLQDLIDSIEAISEMFFLYYLFKALGFMG